MAWDSDKSTASDPDNPQADEQLTADEWDNHVSEGHFPSDELNFGIDGNGDPVITDPQNSDETVMRYDRSTGSWVVDILETDTLDVLDVDESPESIDPATDPVDIDIDASNWWQPIAVTENVGINLNNASTGGNSLLLYFEDGDGAGPYTLSWPSSVVWSGGSAITEVPANDNIRISLTSPDGGTTWYAVDAGSGFA